MIIVSAGWEAKALPVPADRRKIIAFKALGNLNGLVILIYDCLVGINDTVIIVYEGRE